MTMVAKTGCRTLILVRNIDQFPTTVTGMPGSRSSRRPDTKTSPTSRPEAICTFRAPFQLRPARISLTEQNDARAPGAQASMAMNFLEADLTPELELNEILWMSVRGADAKMPPPIRSAFIRGIESEEEEERKK